MGTHIYLFWIVSRTTKETHTDSSSKKGKMSETELVTTALEFLARASSTSEVLTLNLTNLLILLGLKALIFGFGLFSVGEPPGQLMTVLHSQKPTSKEACAL